MVTASAEVLNYIGVMESNAMLWQHRLFTVVVFLGIAQ